MKIFLVRHADYDNYGLTSHGRKQAKEGSRKIAANGRFFKSNTLILSSPQTRAIETAEIIARKLKLAFETVEWLDCDNPNLKRLNPLLKKNDIQNLILITHFSQVLDILARYKYYVDCAKCGSVHLIDTKTKKVKEL